MPILRAVLCAVTLMSCVASEDVDPVVDDPMDPPEEPMMPPPDDPTPETPAQAAERVITQWQQCMQLSDFEAAKMATAWATLPTQNTQTCATCHGTGGWGFIATTQSMTFFNALQTEKYMLLAFLVPDLSQGTAGAKMIINMPLLGGVASGAVPHAEHPRYAFPANAGMTALRDFYDRTMVRITSGGCSVL